MKQFTVVGTYTATGQIFSPPVRASSGLSSFQQCVSDLGRDIECIAAVPGALIEDVSIYFPGSTIVDGETIADQPEVFGA